MIFKLAWKNVWRNRTRSLVVIGSIILGLWAGIFLNGFFLGMTSQRSGDILRSEISHIQVHHEEFKSEFKPELDIGILAKEIVARLDTDRRVESYTTRSISVGMIATAHANTGAQLVGINPESEAKLTHLEEYLIEGEFLKANSRNKCLIGQELAEKLKVRLGSKVILSFQNLNGEISQIKLKVVGLYQTVNTAKDRLFVYLPQSTLNGALGDAEIVHEIAVFANNRDDIVPIRDEIRSAFPSLLTEYWGELSPELELLAETSDQYMIIFMGIIMAALAFGIINTMLMAILERTKEIGMLKAIGMSRGRVFSLIMFETLFLVLVGTPLGIALGFLTIQWTNRVGIDLSYFSEGLRSFGYDTLVRPEIPVEEYMNVLVLVVVVAFIAAIYPSFKALRLNTLEALRKI